MAKVRTKAQGNGAAGATRTPRGEAARIAREVSIERLVEARGIDLARRGSDCVGVCPFHNGDEVALVVDSTRNTWRCRVCDLVGGPIEFLARVEGISRERAVELLCSGRFAPTDLPLSTLPTTPAVPKLDAIIEPDDPDHVVVERVVGYYHEMLKQSPEALAYLRKRGLSHSELLDMFKLGFSDRTLGLRLPKVNRRAGWALRSQLQRLGILRGSGHEHFNGSIVVPIFDGDGKVVQMYGRKVTPNLKAGTPLHLYLPGPMRGVFNLRALAPSRDVIVTRSILDALTFWCHDMRNVTCSWGYDFTDEHLDAFIDNGVERVLVAYPRTDAGDAAAQKLANVLSARGMQCFRIVLPTGLDVADYAVSDAVHERGLDVLVRNAIWLAGTRSAPVPATLAPMPTGDTVPPVPPFLLPPSEPEVDTDEREHEIRLRLGDRRWRIRGLEKNTSFERLKCNVLVSRDHAEASGFHVDNVELYSARQRAVFIRDAALELGLEERVVKADLAKVLLELERLQEEHIRRTLEPKNREVVLTDAERDAALALLRDPRLVDRILDDYERCGLVGERDNALIAYLIATSRLLQNPLAVIIQSASSAGKSSLMEAVLGFVPDESRVSYSAMTAQSLYYMPEANLRHKVLAIAEQEGADSAAYALKLLQSEGALTIASTGKDAKTGRHVTHDYRVEGPVAVVLTTTSLGLDEELLNRCLVLTVDEGAEQTRKIHDAQRRAETLEGLAVRQERARLARLHQNAQRLLSPMLVVNPQATGLAFAGARTRARRDHAKYLAIIRASALLHQHQRPVRSVEHEGAQVRYVEATDADVALADRLFAVLRPGLEELPPQTAKLLGLVERLVDVRADREGLDPCDVRFTRREVREATGWGNTALKTHMARLVDLEHLTVHTGGARRRITYGLACTYDANWSGPTGNWSGSGQPLVVGAPRPDSASDDAHVGELVGVSPGSTLKDATTARRTVRASAAPTGTHEG